jgi:hypothetical protein
MQIIIKGRMRLRRNLVASKEREKTEKQKNATVETLWRSSHGEGSLPILFSSSGRRRSRSWNISTQISCILSWNLPEQCISIDRITGKGLFEGGEKAELFMAMMTSRKKILVHSV